MNIYEQYKKLNIDKSIIGLQLGSKKSEYFCTPKGMEIIGWEGVDGIHYGFIKGFNDMVFAVNPMSSGINKNNENINVYPLAENFETFLRIVLFGKGVTGIEQIVWMNKNQFNEYLRNDNIDNEEFIKKRDSVLNVIKEELSLEEFENTFEYVKALQEKFDYSKLEFTDEYYEALGLI